MKTDLGNYHSGQRFTIPSLEEVPITFPSGKVTYTDKNGNSIEIDWDEPYDPEKHGY
jgi:hypothetical protein